MYREVLVILEARKKEARWGGSERVGLRVTPTYASTVAPAITWYKEAFMADSMEDGLTNAHS